LDKIIKKFVQKNGTGAFVRLNTRSPKDAVIISEIFDAILEEDLNKIPEGDENLLT